MKITSITVTAGRTFNHPHESYANFRFELTFKADLRPDDLPGPAMAVLREIAEQTAETHKAAILRDVRNQMLREALESEVESGEAAEAQLAKLRGQLEQLTPDQDYKIDQIEREIKSRERSLARLPEARAELAAIPAPQLLATLTVHPGHPDHPATDDDDGLPY